MAKQSHVIFYTLLILTIIGLTAGLIATNVEGGGDATDGPVCLTQEQKDEMVPALQSAGWLYSEF